jgi:hypothetical protein
VNKYNFTINAALKYQLNLSNQLLLTGSTVPGIFSYHNGSYFSAYDCDNDIFGGSCSASIGSTAWWYKSCWLGSIWGTGGISGAFWDTSSGTAFNWGAIWVR